MARSTVEVQFGGASPEARQESREARDLQTLTYTLLGEAAGEGVEGMVGVANVIRNRANSGIYSSDPVEVTMQRWQFSTNNDLNGITVGGNQLGRNGVRARYPVGSALYQQAQAVARQYIVAQDSVDLTGGSLFYHRYDLDWRYANDVVGPYGTHQIGDHVFYPAHPVPQVDVGETELLQGYRMQPPVPLPRSARPRAPATSDGIDQLRTEMAIERVVQARAQFIAAVPAAARGALGVDAITPVLDGENVRPQMDARYDPARGAFITADQFGSEWNGAMGPPTQALGMGAVLGRAFPLTTPNPVAAVPPGGARPEGPAAGMPGARPFPLPPIQRQENPGPPVDNTPVRELTDTEKFAIRELGAKTIAGGIVREKVGEALSDGLGNAASGVEQTISGAGRLLGGDFPEYSDTVPLGNYVRPEGPAAGMPAQSSIRLPSQDAEVDETDLITRKVRTIRIDPYTSQPILEEEPAGPSVVQRIRGPVQLTALQRVEQAQAVKAGSAAANAATSRQPMPLPRDARPAREPLLAEKLNVQPLKPSAPVIAPSSTSTTVRSPSSMPISPNMPVVKPTTIRPLTSITSGAKGVSGIGTAPKLASPAPAQTFKTVTKVVTVRQDGSASTFKPGAAEMPKGARPASVPLPTQATVAKPIGKATQTTDPAMRNAITGLKTSAPGAGLSASQKNAMNSLAGTNMSNAIPPVPAAPLARPKATAPAPARTAPTTRTITVQRVVPVAPPPPPQIRGSATGRAYNVGGLYASGAYVYQAQQGGGFKKVAGIGQSSASTYAALNSGPGSVAAMERQHSGNQGSGGGPAVGGDYGGGTSGSGNPFTDSNIKYGR